MLLPGELASEMVAPERIRSMISRWLQPSDYVVERAAVYTFHATLANRWREGPILVAGDAAHQMPPFLGQGLGSGARDAANLAWKLDLVLRGVAKTSLLDTYQAERSPHVRALIESDLWLSNIIQTTDPEVAQQRDQQMTTTSSGGALVPPDPPLGGDLCDDGVASRRPCIQPVLDSGLLHDDVLGNGFTLLGATPPSAWAGHVLQALGARLVPDPAPVVAEWLRSLGSTSVLIRPDRYVLAQVQDTEGLDCALGPLVEHLALDAMPR
jgi:3-(3-hydroxy-phenyl)propionate hydroxylase